jgi:hypothetical protein
MARIFILTIAILILSEYSAIAQCCSAGNPFFYGEQANMGHKELQTILGYKYSTSDTYYTGSEEIDIDFVDKAWFNYLNLQMIYGITSRLSVQTDLGYFINKTEDYSKGGWTQSKGYGLGDLTLTFKYLAYRNSSKGLSLIPSLGVKFPIGVFDQEVDNVKLPITVQPSSGSYKYLANIYFNKKFKNPKWNLGAFTSFEYAQLIDSENFYYKYGNMFLLSVIGSYMVHSKINFGLEMRADMRGKSQRENEQVVESSGYSLVYTIPHVSYSFAKKWLLSLNAEIPVYRYYNEIQMGNKFSVSAQLSYRVSFRKKAGE